VFYKPDECGLDFSGVPRPATSPVLSPHVWPSSLSSSLASPPPAVSPFRSSSLVFLPPLGKLLEDYADPTSSPLFSRHRRGEKLIFALTVPERR